MCVEQDTAYRVFDKSFVYDAATHTMVYEPLAMRDGEYVHTHFGAEGLCRTSNVGFDMQVCVTFSCVCVYTFGITGWENSF
jgi:hypothetical protein